MIGVLNYQTGNAQSVLFALRHLGLDRSYLFLNSFVYPIFGQYTDDLRPLAQDRRSPIVAHRHRILDKAVVAALSIGKNGVQGAMAAVNAKAPVRNSKKSDAPKKP